MPKILDDNWPDDAAVEAAARALCATSVQALNATQFNDRGKRRYETVQEYVDAHWSVFWPDRARTALIAARDTVPDAETVAPPGWKLVPIEPTDEMYMAALAVTRDPGYGHVHDCTGGAVWRAMLAVIKRAAEG